VKRLQIVYEAFLMFTKRLQSFNEAFATRMRRYRAAIVQHLRTVREVITHKLS
jgi:hypothetical protein